MKSAPSNFPKWKVLCTNENPLNLRTKLPCLGMFRLQFQKTIVIFEISTLKFSKVQNFVQNVKVLKYWIKITLFEYFWAGVSKNYCNI